MDRQYIQDHQVIERYLRGTLTEDEARQFEVAYVADSSLLDEVELAACLKQSVGELSAAGAIERARAPRFGFLRSPQYAMAASVLLAVTLVFSGTLYRENAALRSSSGPIAGPAPMRLVPIFTLRGENAATVEAPDAGEWLVLLLDPGTAMHDTYRAVVTARGAAQGGEDVDSWIVPSLEAGDDALIPIGFPPGLLGPGDYEIALEGRMRDWPDGRGFEPVSSTPITITAAEP